MVGEIIAGVSIKLNQVFGDDYEIYVNEVKQGLQEPCFFIKCLNINQDKVIGNRYFRSQPFDIHYFPERKENSELFIMAEKLFDELEYITLENGDLLRGSKMNIETVDGILHFFVNYDLYVLREQVKEGPMEILHTIGRVK
jgi:hypothetical protein